MIKPAQVTNPLHDLVHLHGDSDDEEHEQSEVVPHQRKGTGIRISTQPVRQDGFVLSVRMFSNSIASEGCSERSKCPRLLPKRERTYHAKSCP